MGKARASAPAGKQSAGILAYRRSSGSLEVLLAHPGGPFWRNKDAGSWTIPKGEPEPGESLAAAAAREFHEETGEVPAHLVTALEPVKQKSGKWIHAWIMEADFPAENLQSNEFTLEWPPRSGKMRSFPEIDRFAWFTTQTAREKINAGQVPLIDALEKKMAGAQ